MSIHFAAARAPGSSALARALAVRRPTRIANDNPGSPAPDRGANPHRAHGASLAQLGGALRHFHRHGLNAVNSARCEFDAALARDDADAAQHWLGICASFDRVLARRLERRMIRA